MRATFIFAILIAPLVATNLSNVSASPLNARRLDRRQDLGNSLGSIGLGIADAGAGVVVAATDILQDASSATGGLASPASGHSQRPVNAKFTYRGTPRVHHRKSPPRVHYHKSPAQVHRHRGPLNHHHQGPNNPPPHPSKKTL